jgi:hypothetical protein
MNRTKEGICKEYCFLSEGCEKSVFQAKDESKRAEFFERIFGLFCEHQRIPPIVSESLKEQLKFAMTFEKNVWSIFQVNCFEAPRGLRKYC